MLDKTKYRPVSVLPGGSKVYEKLMSNQLIAFFESILHSALSGYRNRYSCEHVLLQASEKWRQALDNGEYVGSILIDLSKAFDSMPHGLTIAKLHAYGVDNDSCQWVLSYLSDRMQRVKLGNSRSEWVKVKKGVPQGSILGPLLFNIFQNDIFFVIVTCLLSNYADDMTLTHSSMLAVDFKCGLESDASNMITWYEDNEMQANPSKFQAIVYGKAVGEIDNFNVSGTVIECSEFVKLLGVTFDSQLKFNKHIENICKTASRQINALMRLSKRLDLDSKIAIFNAFILSNFNYCPLVWMCCGKANVDRIERLQYRALKFVYNEFDESYETLLVSAKCKTLLVSRMQKLAIAVYKAINRLSPSYVNEMFRVNECNYNLRNPYPLEQKPFKTVTYGYRSFSYMGSKLWNELPNQLKSITSESEFKEVISKWDGPCTSDKWF